jgi:hypothetical protein
VAIGSSRRGSKKGRKKAGMKEDAEVGKGRVPAPQTSPEIPDPETMAR